MLGSLVAQHPEELLARGADFHAVKGLDRVGALAVVGGAGALGQQRDVFGFLLGFEHFNRVGADARVGEAVQFECTGYFAADPDSEPGRPVFNRTVGLRDTWAKVAAGAKG